MLRTHLAAPALVLALLLSPLEGRGQVGQALEITRTDGIAVALVSATAVEEPPTLDGRLDDEVWQRAELLEGFVQREPVEGSPASELTRAAVLFDGNALYIGVWALDSDPSGIIPGENRRDVELDQSDAISFVLDTYLDRQNGYVFGTTPAGIEYDGQLTGEGQGGASMVQRQQRGTGAGFNKNWDGSWDVAVSRDGEGWYAEFRIPFSTLRYDGQGVQEWGFNVSRRIRRRNEEVFWSPVSRQFNLYRVSQAGVLQGVETPPTRNFFVTPFVLASGEKVYQPDTDPEGEVSAGGDAKISLTPSLTLDLTVNTDFAQVEVDDQQINLTRFPVFFPEKRPFFLENAGTFAVGTPQTVELFFSRRVGLQRGYEVPILAGGRVTGKLAGLTVGILNIQTRATDIVDPESGEDVALTPNENFGNIRVFREFGNRTRLGGTFITRINTDDLGGSSDSGDEGLTDYNLTYGLDGRLGIGEYLTLDGYVAATRTPELDGDEYAYSMGADYQSRDWTLGLMFQEVGDAFNPEVGFLSRDDFRFVQARILRRYRFDSVEWFRELRPHITYREHWDRDWFTETRLLHVDSHFELSNGAFFQLPAVNFTEEGLKEEFEIHPGVVVPAGTYRNVEWGFRANTNLSAPFSVEGRIDIGGFYSGNRYGTDATVNYRWSDKFLASGRVAYYDVNLEEGDFETALYSLKGAYSFTPRIYVQATVQYLDQTGNFSGNLRFGWLNTAGTGLYVVFNDLEHFGAQDGSELPEGPLNRSIIVKYTRQFDLLR
jgi:hypothetical protein